MLVNSDLQPEDEVQEVFDESCSEEIGTDRDDSDQDPTFDIREETCTRLSQLSLKKSKSRIPKSIIVDSNNQGEIEVDDVETIKVLDESDLNDFDKVEKLIQAGQLKKPKVEECKLYLRKHGLRLTGNKDVLIQRIREHLEIINGGGEHKYPASSFVLNCKGDACTGDIVMFEQNVYEMFSIASRSSTGPPCGTRVIAGRIVKESYGAAKQQHTFTIEVLWSKGVKPLPPLHPLLIKGRNLYRLQTMRQRWDDEEKRRQVLLEKHSRGASARSNRETRIQVKEMRKTIIGQRVTGTAQEQRRQPRADTLKTNIQSQTQQQPVVAPVILNQWSTQFTQEKPATPPNTVPVVAEIWQQNVSRLQPNVIKPQNRNVIEQKTWGSENPSGAEQQNNGLAAVENHQRNGFHPVAKMQHCYASKDHRSHDGSHGYNHGASNRSLHKQPSILSFPPRSPMHHLSRNDHGFNVQRCPNENGKFPPRQPLTSLNSPPRNPLHRWDRPMERQVCRYYPLGRCHYGDNCRYVHENGDKREQRLPNNQRYYGYH